MTPLDALLVALLAGGAAFMQALTGFGFSLLIVPPLALVIGPKEAVVVANVLSASVNTFMLWRLHAAVAWRVVVRLLAGALVGMPVGLAVLILISPRALQVVIAVMVLVFTWMLARGFRLTSPGKVVDGVMGVASGVLNTSTSMSGPPVVLYLQGRRFEPDEFRATLAAYFLGGGLAAVGLFAAAGRVDGDIALASLVAVPPLFGGVLLGALVYTRVNAVVFRRIVLATLVFSAVLAIVTAV